MSQRASSLAAVPERMPLEFEFNEDDFRFLVELAYRRAGIALADSKRQLVYGRLSRRLRAIGLNSFREYRALLEQNEGEEIERFINSISTNHTKFFREDHHFAHLRDQVAIPFSKGELSTAPLKLWSAGCSSGEEPYSIAAVLRREMGAAERRAARILATDIDTDVLAKATRGHYEIDALANIPEPYRGFFKPHRMAGGEGIVASPALQEMIAFKYFNFMSERWPMKGPFDAIFCRNVMIYFDAKTKARLIERFTDLLRIGGWLYIGHSESLLGSHPRLQLAGRTIYKRIA